MSVTFQIATIILTAITMATALAHALELPGKMRLTREQYLAVQRIYYPGFTLAGAAEPLAIVALAVQLALTPSGLPIFWITAGALAASALTHLLYWLLTAPVNKVWVKDEKLSGAAQTFFGAGKDALATEDWMKLRDRWEYSHLYRAISAVTAFVLATVAGVFCGRGPRGDRPVRQIRMNRQLRPLSGRVQFRRRSLGSIEVQGVSQ